MTTTGIGALVEAKELLGSEQAVADAVGVKQPSVNHIIRKGQRVPAEWCIPLELATKKLGKIIERWRFRPDLWPDDAKAGLKAA